jgi:hypothetical protein
MMRKQLSQVAAVILFLLVVFTANAQKLPNVQQISLRAPVNVKVDGKPGEWGEHLQAYNHATDVFYTIANDDDNLYLVIQTKDAGNIHKINSGHIAFTISRSGKQKDVNPVIISYPVGDKKDKVGLLLKDKPEIIPGSVISVRKADSFMNVNNKILTDRAKFINVKGIVGLDTLISIYNEDGIKAAALFDHKMVYTCEIAVSLKLLGLSANAGTTISYNLMINPVGWDDLPGVEITRGFNGEITSINVHKEQALPSSVNLTAATDFWGEYTLAKK